MYTYKYGPKHTLMYSWCELGYDYYLFFVGKGVLCCCRLASYYVFASGCTRVKTASRRTLRIPYLDGPQIGNRVELPLKSDFIQNEALPGNSCVCCVRCWRSSKHTNTVLSCIFPHCVETSERKTPLFKRTRDETLAIYSKNHHRCALLAF